jgi:hypothetical protein
MDLKQQLKDAEALLKYAASVGIEIADDEREANAIRAAVLDARLSPSTHLPHEKADALLVALTHLSKRLHPVTGESLCKCVVDEEAEKTMKSIQRRVFGLSALIILPFSIAAFIATSICGAIREDIETANGLVVKLVRDVSPALNGQLPVQPVDDAKLTDLQRLAALVRDIEKRAESLSWFGAHTEALRGFELQVPLENFAGETVRTIKAYQRVRGDAQSVQERVSVGFGAVSACLLPMVYAMLGACAYLIRMFERQIEKRTFTGKEKMAARLLVAAIGGLVVGLFGNFGSGHGISLPPLAIAFLVGYGVDVFFRFLEGLLQTFSRSSQPAASQR